MSRYDVPDPLCRHRPTVRVSSHVDLVAAAVGDESVASTYCCDRPTCRADAADWLRATTHRDAIHIIPLPGKETR